MAALQTEYSLWTRDVEGEMLVDELKALAAKEGCTPAQLAIAWLLSRPPHLREATTALRIAISIVAM